MALQCWDGLKLKGLKNGKLKKKKIRQTIRPQPALLQVFEGKVQLQIKKKHFFIFFDPAQKMAAPSPYQSVSVICLGNLRFWINKIPGRLLFFVSCSLWFFVTPVKIPTKSHRAKYYFRNIFVSSDRTVRRKWTKIDKKTLARRKVWRKHAFDVTLWEWRCV